MSGPSPIRTVEVFRVPVPFAQSFRLGSGSVDNGGGTGDVVFVRIETEDGIVGWGEQRALPSWSYETAETIVSVIEGELAPLMIGLSPYDIATFHRSLSRTLSPSVSNGFPFAQNAVDIAMHDAAGRLAGVPVHDLLGGRIQDRIPLCSAIGIDTPEAVQDRVRHSSDLHAYKIKISGSVEADVAAVQAAAEVAQGKPLWLDANQSYRPSALRVLLDRIADVPGLWCVEQPVRSTDWGSMVRLRRDLTLPLALDEGSFTAADLARAVTLGAADMVVVKTCKSGGLRQAQKTITVAEAHGIELLASGLTDTGIGFAAALHLFSGHDLALPAELNGPELLAELYVEGLEFVDGHAVVPTGHGLGVEVDEDRIRSTAH